MALLISFLIGIQMLHLVAAATTYSLLSPPCNSSVVKTAAEVTLDKLNADRTEGYVLALQRVFNAHEIPEWNGHSFFFLTIDVLETDCHVLSRKPWKECEIRDAYETVHGQCELTIFFDSNSNNSELHKYHCDLHPISRSSIALICPDCPIPGSTSEANFQQTALETLDKFNAENEHNHLFRLDKVTKASLQWFVGPTYLVEYTIHETSCGKSPPVSNITECPLLPVETAERGLCEGSVSETGIDNEKFVTVKCNFFPRPPPVTGEQIPQSQSTPGQEEHHDDGEGQREHHDKSGHHHQHSHNHHHKHNGQGQEHQEPQQSHPTAGIPETPSKQKKTEGQVIIHPPSSEHPLPEVQEPNPTSGPTLASPEQEAESHSDEPGRTSPLTVSPDGFSLSDKCPGDSAIEIPGLKLPSRPKAESSKPPGRIGI